MKIPDSLVKSFAEAVFKTKKNSPHIFFAAGVVGIVGSAILACRATLQLEDTIEDIKRDVEDVNAKSKELAHSTTGHEVLTPEIVDRQHGREVALVSVKGALAIGKLYGPAVVLGGISVACLAGSHVQMTRRNAVLTAALTSITKAYDEYRERVRREIGEEREYEIYRGVEMMEITNEAGKKELVATLNPDGHSPFARRFNEHCAGWRPSNEHNRTFLELQQRYANLELDKYGYLFLNDVYKMLGFEKTPEGQIYGWIKDPGEGDNFVDFGLFPARDYRYATDPDMTMFLDFNVDGVIVDKIGRKVK